MVDVRYRFESFFLGTGRASYVAACYYAFLAFFSGLHNLAYVSANYWAN